VKLPKVEEGGPYHLWKKKKTDPHHGSLSKEKPSVCREEKHPMVSGGSQEGQRPGRGESTVRLWTVTISNATTESGVTKGAGAVRGFPQN